MGKVKGMMTDMIDTPEYEEGYEAFSKYGPEGGRNPYPMDQLNARRCWALGWDHAHAKAYEESLKGGKDDPR